MGDTSRRRFLAGVSTAAVGAVAGCSALRNSSGGSDIGETTVVNQTTTRIAGSISVSGPDGETVLDETFDLRPAQSGVNDTTTPGGDTGTLMTAYEDVFVGTGAYGVSVRLDEGFAVNGVREAETDAEVADTEEEGIVVLLGAVDGSEPISIRVAEEGPAIG